MKVFVLFGLLKTDFDTIKDYSHIIILKKSLVEEMENKSKGNFNWAYSQDCIAKVLGDDFWNEISGVLPKMGPSIDVYETDTDVVILAEIPGINSPDMVVAKLSGFKLAVSGKIPYTYPVSQDKLLRSERFFGDFRREIELPCSIDPGSEIRAQYRSGIIEIRLKKAGKLEEKSVPIEFNE